MSGSARARFDALGTGSEARSFVFDGYLGEIVAFAPEEVAPAIERVQRVVADGGHAAGFVAYEAAPGLEAALATRPAPPGTPLVWFGVYESKRPIPALVGLPGSGSGYSLGPLQVTISEDRYIERVRRILELIGAGDTYQVNFTMRMRGGVAGDALALYRELCEAQRSNYCAYLGTPHGSVISASPELFFRLEGRHLQLRPMKGTRPRGRWVAEDRRLARDLVDSPKDRAENLMIVDLLRNDAGRVAEFGSIHVPELFRVERYPTVHQLTSEVHATVREDVTLLDLFRALFPSGSVTGAPKIRTSEIIRDLEDSPRGVYTGAVGFVSPGEAVFSVGIRTLWMAPDGRSVEVGIGSGITSDSSPREELGESLGKQKFLRYRAPAFHLIESLRLEANGTYPLIDLHLERLGDSADYFGVPFDSHEVRATLDRAAAEIGTGVHKVRLLVGRDGRLDLSWEGIPECLPVARLGRAVPPVDDTDPFLYHKTTAHPAIGAAVAIPAGLDDVVFRNLRGELTETTRANLVLDLDGELLTPPVESGLLQGVMRETLLRDGTIRTRVLTEDDLRRARRVFLINAVRGWREARLVD